MAWTNPRTWADDPEVWTASMFNTDIRDNEAEFGSHRRVRKTADESLASSTTLQDDDHLFFAVGTNEFWTLELVLFYRTTVTADFKVGFSVPAGGAFDFAFLPHFQNSFATVQGSEGFQAAATEADFLCHIVGDVRTGATAGDVRLRWAQNTSDAGTTKVYANSSLLAARIV